MDYFTVTYMTSMIKVIVIHNIRREHELVRNNVGK